MQGDVRMEGKEKGWVVDESERWRMDQKEKETGISSSSGSPCLILLLLLLLGGGTTVMTLPNERVVLRVRQACCTCSCIQVQISGLWCWRSGIR